MLHRVGLVVKEDIVSTAGTDGIAIECISARLLKARILINSEFVTFMVVYSPTEEVPGRKKA